MVPGADAGDEDADRPAELAHRRPRRQVAQCELVPERYRLADLERRVAGGEPFARLQLAQGHRDVVAGVQPEQGPRTRRGFEKIGLTPVTNTVDQGGGDRRLHKRLG